MLLETLDIIKNDIIIYSLNNEKLENNFKIIFKNDPEKKIRKITFLDVCKFINDFTPKNLIVYRLLTNIPEFELSNPRYGIKMIINGFPEIIFLDPVMAIKELHEYPEAINYYDLRFRIQQVGLTTQNRFGDQPNYAEIYSVDLEADEAANQNDRTFVDALLVVASVNKSKEIAKKKGAAKKINNSKKEDQTDGHNPALNKEHNTQASIRKVEQSETKRRMNVLNNSHFEEENANKVRRKITNHNLDEDKDFDLRTISKVNIKHEKSVSNKVSASDSSSQKIKNVENTQTKTQEKKKGAFGEFLEKKKQEDDLNLPLNSKENPKQMVEIFKSPTSLNKFLDSKGDKKVVLKLKNQK